MKRLVSLFFLCLLAMGLTSNAMNQAKINYYEILGVAQDATAQEISKAYKTLARQNHPDKHPGDKAAEERFKLITTAYETLKDDSKKLNYTYYLGSIGFLQGEPFYSNRIYDKPVARNNGSDNASNAAQNDPFADFFNKYGGKDGGFHSPKCYSCNVSKSGLWRSQSPCCMQKFHLCDDCVDHFANNKKGMKCPHCPKIFVVEGNKFDFNLKETFKCNGPGCTKITTKRYNNPCCFLSSKISLCSTCSAKPQIQCPNCTKNIDIESKSGSVKLKKPVAMKYCSGHLCFNKIPETTQSYHNPCCYSQISLCAICLTQAQMQCPDCKGNIEIERKYGSINLKKPVAMKKCSNFSCNIQIPITTRRNFNPCCGYTSAIYLCETCLTKSQILCPNCTGIIDVERKYGSINLKKSITMKKCSEIFCFTQIPETTPFDYSPCCYSKMSFCGKCSTKKDMRCSVCHEEIEIESKFGEIKLKKKQKPIAMKKCSNRSCYRQIPHDTEFGLNPCCFGDISLCGTCSLKTHISCPHCYNRVDIKRNIDGRVRFEKPIRHQPVPNVPFGQRPNHTRSFAGSFVGKAVLLGTATTALWYCSSAWRKHSLRNELDAIKQHANKLIEERYLYSYEMCELSPFLSDQFNIVQLIQKLTYYTSNTVDIENAINGFDEAIGSKNSNQHATEDCFEELVSVIDDCKNRVGSPKTSILGAGFIAIGGVLLGKKLL